MLFRSFLALLVLAVSAVPALATANSMQRPPKSRPAGLPPAYVMVSPCVPSMGEHWANPKDLGAPIYGVYHGKVVFSEIMVPKAQFEKGFNYEDLRATPGHAIDHVDIEYEPNGHPGMTIPHYDIHAYYVTHATHMAYCKA